MKRKLSEDEIINFSNLSISNKKDDVWKRLLERDFNINNTYSNKDLYTKISSLVDISYNKLELPEDIKYRYQSFAKISNNIGKLNTLVNQYENKEEFLTNLFKNLFLKVLKMSDNDCLYTTFFNIISNINLDNIRKLYIKCDLEELYNNIILNMVLISFTYKLETGEDMVELYGIIYFKFLYLNNKKLLRKHMDIIGNKSYDYEALNIISKIYIDELDREYIMEELNYLYFKY